MNLKEKALSISIPDTTADATSFDHAIGWWTTHIYFFRGSTPNVFGVPMYFLYFFFLTHGSIFPLFMN